jgi:dTDP-4-amino-4,6-dideoxygalactose transaminase
MSFHATKCFATGEGGAVVSTDVELTQKVTQALNYGFYGDHDSRAASTNGKMSEYHAAIGLAELDLFPEKLQKLCVVARRYKERLDMAKLPDRIVSFPDIGASYVLFRCADPSHAETVIAAFAREAVECRRWYGTGIHRHPHFAAAARDDLPVTDDLAPRLIALPLAPDLSATDTERVADVVISTSKTLPVS